MHQAMIETEGHAAPAVTLICFTDRPWTAGDNRLRALMHGMARHMPVVIWESALVAAQEPPSLRIRSAAPNVTVVTPLLPEGLDTDAIDAQLDIMTRDFANRQPGKLICWYRSPAALAHSREMTGICTVYDCAEAWAASQPQSARHIALETELYALADLVFTDSEAEAEVRRHAHGSVHPFPSPVGNRHVAFSAWSQLDGSRPFASRTIHRRNARGASPVSWNRMADRMRGLVRKIIQARTGAAATGAPAPSTRKTVTGHAYSGTWQSLT